jgi:hypothetical protein
MFDDPKPGDLITCTGLELGPVAVGDVVKRIMCGTAGMNLQVTEVTDNLIMCGSWQFDLKTGAEIDEDFEWTAKSSPSFITRIEKKGVCDGEPEYGEE